MIANAFDEWRAHLKAMVEFSNKGQKDEAQKEGEAARATYPQYVWDANPYGLLADIDLLVDRFGEQYAATSTASL